MENFKYRHKKYNILIKQNNIINKLIILFILFIFIYIVINSFKITKLRNSYSYINYIKSCKNLKKINNNKNKKKFIFISICITAFNSEKYIQQTVLSIINQSFQNFEIIIVNDFSNDKTSELLIKMKTEDNRIKIINHNKNLGIYHSKVEGALNSKGKYILFLDSDDMFLNPHLFEELFNYTLYYNLDIIEFTIYYFIEKKRKLYYPRKHFLNHFHNFQKKIIYQPELSNIIFYEPNTKNYSSIICRTLCNKLYKKDIFLKSIKYIGNDYYLNYYINVAEDTLLNIINFQFANNYSNLNLPGYLYNIRKNSITHLKEVGEYLFKKSISFFLFYQMFYKYIKEFDKDRNYLYYDLKEYGFYLNNLKFYNIKNYCRKFKNMLNEIINDNKASMEFKNYLMLYFNYTIKI